MLIPSVFLILSVAAILGGLFLSLLASADPECRAGWVIALGLGIAASGIGGLFWCFAQLFKLIS